MIGIQPHVLDNPAWHALTTHHAHLADTLGPARRYRTNVSPFYAVDRITAESWGALAELAGPGGHVVLARGEAIETPQGWETRVIGAGHQMVATELVDVPDVPLAPLTPEHVPQMLELVALAQPGPFLPETIQLGSYFGVLDGGQLLAMAGERLRPPGYTEVSAVCTHPDARGRGYAAALTRHVACRVLERGDTPFLHVAATNDNARRVYERLGFATRVMINFAVFTQAAAQAHR